MTRTTPTSTTQPTLAELMSRFLASRSDAAAAAVEFGEGEVEPHEIAAGFRVDSRAAWTDALHALDTPASSPKASVPSDWAALVSQPAPAFAVALAAGNFPQRVRDLHPLLAKFDPATLRPSGPPSPSPGLSGLRTWVVRESKKRQPAAALLAAGVARAMGEAEWAAELLADAESLCTGEMRAAWENERAALLWHSGRCDEAFAAWSAMPESPAVLFNRGMAALFLGKSSEARVNLRKAADQLPEENGWNSLARLYLALAEIQG
jgi:tetratricopeptide (TPR) repeat protein